jgi:outer membrane receptor for monomeric catechols
MTMRDLQRLEELSSAAALGLWADDVVLALDRATSDAALADADAQLLNGAAEMLEATLQRTEKPLATPKSARTLAATNTALTIVATIVREQPGTNEHEILTAMAGMLREAGNGTLTQTDTERVDPVMELFGMLGEHQLVESNSVLASRKDSRAWTATPSISNSF